MTKTYKNPNLNPVKRIPVKAGKYFILHEGIAYTSSPYGDNRYIEVIDINDPLKAKLITTIVFKNAISYIQAYKNRLYAYEHNRAFHIIDISIPQKPVIIDCIPLLGHNISSFALINDKTAIAVFSYSDFLGLIDLTETFKIQPVQKLDVSELRDSIFLCEDHLLFCNNKDTLLSGAFNNGRIEIQNRYFLNDFKGESLFISNDKIYVWGEKNNDSKDENEKINLIILDRKNPSSLLKEFHLSNEPECIMPMRGNSFIFMHQSYTCSYADENESKSMMLFKQYETREKKVYYEVPAEIKEDENGNTNEVCQYPQGVKDLQCMNNCSHGIRRDKYFFSIHTDEFIIWEIMPGSIFEQLLNG